MVKEARKNEKVTSRCIENIRKGKEDRTHDINNLLLSNLVHLDSYRNCYWLFTFCWISCTSILGKYRTSWGDGELSEKAHILDPLCEFFSLITCNLYYQNSPNPHCSFHAHLFFHYLHWVILFSHPRSCRSCLTSN